MESKAREQVDGGVDDTNIDKSAPPPVQPEIGNTDVIDEDTRAGSMAAQKGSDTEEVEEEGNESTVGNVGSDEEDDKDKDKRAGYKRTAKQDRPRGQAKKGKLQPEEITGNELFVRGFHEDVGENKLKEYFKKQEIDVKSIEFIVGRSMCFVQLTNEMKSSQVDIISNLELDGKSLYIELLENKSKESAPETGKNDKGEKMGKDKNRGKNKSTEDITKKTENVNRGKTESHFSDKVDACLGRVLDLIRVLEKNEELTFDLGLMITRGIILADENNDGEFGKKITEYLRGCNIITTAKDVGKPVDADGVNKLFQTSYAVNAPAAVLLRNIDAASHEASQAIIDNLRNIAANHLPIITIGTTIHRDQIDNIFALFFTTIKP